MNNVKIDPDKRSKAVRALTLRTVVAVYIAYLAFKIASAQDTTMSLTLCRVIGALFLVASICVAAYTYTRYRSDMKDAVIDSDGTEEVTADEGAEVSGSADEE